MDWISVDESKPTQDALLAVLLTDSGKYVIRRGCYYDKHEEKTFTYYIPQGWYEAIANWDEYSTVHINEGIVTHWMPLPEAPK